MLRPTASGVISYSPRPIDLGTGEQNYVRDPMGAVDTKWRTGPTGTGPAYSTWSSAWYSGSTISNWITGPPGGPGITRYQVTFDAGNAGTTGGLALRFAADNDVTFSLNGVEIGGYAGGPTDPSSFNQLHDLSVANVPLRPGPNVLEAVVTDYGGLTGLLVEGGAYVCRVVDALAQVGKEFVDPTMCPVLQSLNGVSFGPVLIKPGTGGTGGDVYVNDELWWDCPTYEPPE